MVKLHWKAWKKITHLVISPVQSDKIVSDISTRFCDLKVSYSYVYIKRKTGVLLVSFYI